MPVTAQSAMKNLTRPVRALAKLRGGAASGTRSGRGPARSRARHERDRPLRADDAVAAVTAGSRAGVDHAGRAEMCSEVTLRS